MYIFILCSNYAKNVPGLNAKGVERLNVYNKWNITFLVQLARMQQEKFSAIPIPRTNRSIRSIFLRGLTKNRST